MIERDVPGPIDLGDPQTAREWKQASHARPGRVEMFEAFVRELRGLCANELAVLELGSGPGFLAAYRLDAFPHLRLTLLDYSAPMHELARARLGPRSTQVHFVDRSFKDSNRSIGLGPFDAVITNQAVHELRHKRHASELHAGVRNVLKFGGTYLVSDHFFGDGGLSDRQLYMTVVEQRASLMAAGFSRAETVAAFGSLVMHRAT